MVKENIFQTIERLRQGDPKQIVLNKLYTQAKVTNENQGWIDWQQLNHRSERELLLAGAVAINDNFLSKMDSSQQPSVIMSIPASGTHVGSYINCVSGIDHSISKKGDDVEGHMDGAAFIDNNGELVIPHVPSYDGKYYAHRFRAVDPDKDKVVGLAESFIATGKTLETYYTALQPLGIQPVVMSIVAMDLPYLRNPQVGYQRLKDIMPIYSVLHVTSLRGGQIQATVNGNGHL